MLLRRGLPLPLLGGFASAIFFCAGCTTPPTEYVEPPRLDAAERLVINEKVFTASWDLVSEKYYDPAFNGVDWAAMRRHYAPAAAVAPDTDALYRIINQMLGELQDTHVHAYLPRQVHEGRTGHKPDTGLRQQKVENRWIVTNVIAGSPAEAAGVKPGWLIASRNGSPPPDDASFKALSVHVGEPVHYVFIDEHDQPQARSIVPELISLDATRFISRDESGGIRYLRFDNFNAAAVAWLNQEIESHPNARGYILDLRSNPGGHRISLRRIVRNFFPQRQRLGQTVDRKGRTRNLDSFTLFSRQYDGMVAILISAATGSSAEILSHVMQFHDRAIVIGQQSAGSVLGADQHRLPDGGYLVIADLDFRGLDGTRLEGIGVSPDIVVPLALADLRDGRDAGLDAALSWLRESLAGDRPGRALSGK